MEETVMKKFKFRVNWDCDREEDFVKSNFIAEVEVPVDIIGDEEALDDFLSDWLSDEYGFCHSGFIYKELKK